MIVCLSHLLYIFFFFVYFKPIHYIILIIASIAFSIVILVVWNSNTYLNAAPAIAPRSWLMPLLRSPKVARNCASHVSVVAFHGLSQVSSPLLGKFLSSHPRQRTRGTSTRFSTTFSFSLVSSVVVYGWTEGALRIVYECYIYNFFKYFHMKYECSSNIKKCNYNFLNYSCVNQLFGTRNQ